MIRNKFIGALLAAAMSVAAVCAPLAPGGPGGDGASSIISTITAEAASGRKFNQNEQQWKSGYYRYGNSSDTLYNAGCGIFAFGNAIWALNGSTVDIRNVASWASGNGSWRPGSGGLIRSTFYSKITAAYGGRYGFNVTSQSFGGITSAALINHLKSGGVAVVHVPNHFIAITGYNASKRTYHVIESAVWSGRGLSADAWVSADKLSKGSTKVDWFCLISNKIPPVQDVPVQDGKIYTIAPKGTSLYIAATGTGNCANVALSNKINNASKWKAHKVGNNWYFENMNAPGKALDVNGSSVTKSGQNVQIYTYNKCSTEYFNFKKVNGYWIIQTTKNGIAVDCKGSASTLKSGSNIWTYTVNNDSTQLFKFTQVG